MAIQTKRCHDIGESGGLLWLYPMGFVLGLFIPFAGLLNIGLFLWLGFAPGDPHANEFGEPASGSHGRS